VASIASRNLDESLKATLRARAARHGRSMEDEGRPILRATLVQDAVPDRNLVERIRARFASFANPDLPQPERDAIRTPPDALG
jgi:plasmid stability protein